ncbi:MAG: DUF58 domain-containing protein [Dehalococcoidia bacterium]
MRTATGAWLVSLSAALVILGLALMEPSLIALVVPLIVYLALAIALGVPEPELVAARRLDKDAVYEGDIVSVTVHLENVGPPVEFLEVYDEVPPELEIVEGSSYVLAQLRRKESLELKYRVRLHAKGRHTIGPLRARVRDLLGLFVHDLELEEPQAVVAAPQIEDIRRLEVYTTRARPWLGQIPSRAPGLGTDYWSIRDYVSGDALRRINWKATARLNRLFTNEFEGERSADFVIVLDAREEAARGPYHQNAVGMGIRAATTLASKLLEARNRVGLIVLRSVLDWVYPAFGRRQFFRISEALVTVRPGGSWTLQHLPWILSRFFPPGCELIIISPAVDAAAREAIVELKAQGFEVTVISPSIVQIEEAIAGDDERSRLARSILQLERDGDIAELRRFARVADWKPGDPLALALKEVSVRGQRRRLSRR